MTDSPPLDSDAAVPPAAKQSYGLISIAVAAAFALFYAYDLWEAVSTLVSLPVFYEAYGLDATFVPWWLLWIGVLIPPVMFGVAFLVGRRQNVFGIALVFLVGLTIVAGLSLGIIALEQVMRPELVAVLNG